MKHSNVINENGTPYRNCYVMEYNGVQTLYSYDAEIARYDTDSGILKVTQFWNYSPTTLKHFNGFVNQYVDGLEFTNAANWRKQLAQNMRVRFLIKLSESPKKETQSEGCCGSCGSSKDVVILGSDFSIDQLYYSYECKKCGVNGRFYYDLVYHSTTVDDV